MFFTLTWMFLQLWSVTYVQHPALILHPWSGARERHVMSSPACKNPAV